MDRIIVTNNMCKRETKIKEIKNGNKKNTLSR
jgi:hypothetical protein